MIRRNISNGLLDALSDTPVVLVHGARQVGKTTLVKALTTGAHPARYLTLDDAVVLSAASSDPAGFLAGLEGPLVIDEVQRAPDLMLAVKAEVDRARKPGRFLLTGSANVLFLPRLADSLAGRMDIVTLWPLSQGEIEGAHERFIDRAFDETLPDSPSPVIRADLVDRVVLGGFPEPRMRSSERRREAWFGAYVTTVLERDVRDLANIEGLRELPRLLRLVAARSGALLSYSELARALALPQTTLKRHFALLEATFLVKPLPAWHSNLGKRLVKSPKSYLCDTGLACHLLGVTKASLNVADAGNALGALLESFVVMELAKQSTWSKSSVELSHFRSHGGAEVDVVIEDRSRPKHLVGIEIKATASPSPRDFAGLRSLKELAGRRFLRGIVLYLGRELVPFADDLFAVPVSALWEW